MDQFRWEVLIIGHLKTCKVHESLERCLLEYAQQELKLQVVRGTYYCLMSINGGDVFAGVTFPSNFINDGGLKLFGIKSPQISSERG